MVSSFRLSLIHIFLDGEFQAALHLFSLLTQLMELYSRLFQVVVALSAVKQRDGERDTQRGIWIPAVLTELEVVVLAHVEIVCLLYTSSPRPYWYHTQTRV